MRLTRPKLEYLTKQKRLVALVEAYLKRTGKTSVTMNEVSEWAIENDLYPVPTRSDDFWVCFNWETDLHRATVEKLD